MGAWRCAFKRRIGRGRRLPRALFTCHNLGVESVGLSADRRLYLSNPYYQLREAIASLRAWWDVKIARPKPVLGAKENMGL